VEKPEGRRLERIDPLVDLLREYWKAHPDLRLGQILSNVDRQIDPFYVEDDVLFEWLKREVKGSNSA
jgi:uncharacterized protein YihD (DUF1040 family)